MKKISIIAILMIIGLLVATVVTALPGSRVSHENSADLQLIPSDDSRPLDLTYSISGHVYIKKIGIPINLARVKWLQGGITVWTLPGPEGSGSYSIDLGTTCPGDTALKASKIFYYPQIKNAEYIGHGRYYADFYLQPFFS
ncbi:MAG: hypothetical protein QHH19_06275 [Candidatus Thermoplasmatota archaeon]|jgi:hypothetical protein|nr:hypothetical protein [Candidatus Thermoplasmatota archaeon]